MKKYFCPDECLCRQDNSLSTEVTIRNLDLVAIPPGRFVMGSTDDEVERCVRTWSTRLASPTYDVFSFRQWIRKECPAFEIDLPGFRIGRYPITNGDYAEFVRATGARTPESFQGLAARREHPVWGVTSEEAEAFATWL